MIETAIADFITMAIVTFAIAIAITNTISHGDIGDTSLIRSVQKWCILYLRDFYFKSYAEVFIFFV